MTMFLVGFALGIVAVLALGAFMAWGDDDHWRGL